MRRDTPIFQSLINIFTKFLRIGEMKLKSSMSYPHFLKKEVFGRKAFLWNGAEAQREIKVDGDGYWDC